MILYIFECKCEFTDELDHVKVTVLKAILDSSPVSYVYKMHRQYSALSITHWKPLVIHSIYD